MTCVLTIDLCLMSVEFIKMHVERSYREPRFLKFIFGWCHSTRSKDRELQGDVYCSALLACLSYSVIVTVTHSVRNHHLHGPQYVRTFLVRQNIHFRTSVQIIESSMVGEPLLLAFIQPWTQKFQGIHFDILSACRSAWLQGLCRQCYHVVDLVLIWWGIVLPIWVLIIAKEGGGMHPATVMTSQPEKAEKHDLRISLTTVFAERTGSCEKEQDTRSWWFYCRWSQVQERALDQRW